MTSENSCRETSPGVAPEGGPCWSHLAFSLSISSCPAAKRSPAPCASKPSPPIGSEGRSQGADASLCPVLAWTPAPSPAGHPFWTRGQGAQAREEPLWPAQNRGECQRQTSSLFNKNERTFESLLEIHYAQGIKHQPLHFLWNGTKDKAVWISCLPSFVDKSSL